METASRGNSRGKRRWEDSRESNVQIKDYIKEYEGPVLQSSEIFISNVITTDPPQLYNTGGKYKVLSATPLKYKCSAGGWTWQAFLYDVRASARTVNATLSFGLDKEDPCWYQPSCKFWIAFQIQILKPDGTVWHDLGWAASQELQRGTFIETNLKDVPFGGNGNLRFRLITEVCQTSMMHSIPAFTKTICSGFLSLLEQGKGADIIILAKGGVQLKAHKAVLIAQSLVLARMIAGNLKIDVESNLEILHMEDVSPETVRLLLRYLYGGELPPQLAVNAVGHRYPCVSELVQVADRFELDELMECFNSTIAHLCDEKYPKNVIFLLELARDFHLEKAYAEIKQFIRNHETMTSYALDALNSCDPPRWKRSRNGNNIN